LSKRGWILLGSAIPVLGLFALLVWASIKSGGNPGGFGVNSKFGEVRIQQRPASEFSLELLDGRTLALTDLSGKVVMLDFWASWCPPCRQEASGLAALYREYAGQPVEFIGIDIWDRTEDSLEHLERYGVTYPNGVDKQGVITIDYGVRGIPEKFFINRDGVLVKKFVGPMPGDTLRAVLDELLVSGASR
jgi:cytochrome c biogenesis protein CcmG, thiol:disulfide interchange protein DsbE